jgi:hypothetical protein
MLVTPFEQALSTTSDKATIAAAIEEGTRPRSSLE